MKILVIEDNPQNMKLLTFVLKKYGHEVIEAFCGCNGYFENTMKALVMEDEYYQIQHERRKVEIDEGRKDKYIQVYLRNTG